MADFLSDVNCGEGFTASWDLILLRSSSAGSLSELLNIMKVSQRVGVSCPFWEGSWRPSFSCSHGFHTERWVDQKDPLEVISPPFGSFCQVCFFGSSVVLHDKNEMNS